MRRAVVALDRGIDLRDAGREVEALGAWDELLAAGGAPPDTELGLVMTRVIYVKAHCLMELERWEDAVVAAGQAQEAAGRQTGLQASLLSADARAVVRDSLTRLHRLDAALEIDDGIVAEYAASDEWDLRDRAARALAHAVWVLMSCQREAAAIARAQQLLAAFSTDGDPAHLARSSEHVLTSAATLDWRRSLIRRPSRSLRKQAGVMREAVIKWARRIGGEIGAVVVINTQIAIADALVQDHRLVKSYVERRDRPAPMESELPALDQVQEQARLAGSDSRFIQIGVLRAVTLHDLGRTDEAINTITGLIHELNQTRRGRERGNIVLLRAIRRALAR